MTEQEQFTARSKRHKQHKKMRKNIVIATLLVVIIGIVFFATRMFGSFSNFLSNIYNEIKPNVVRDQAVKTAKGDPVSILLMGIDYGAEENRSIEEGGRSDTMIVLTINPAKKQTTVVSIPRDTYVTIVGNKSEDKINHAFFYGKTEMAINTVQHFLNIPIDYYMEVSMDGLKGIVDAIGGVTIQNELEFVFEERYYGLGTIHLDGAQALGYARMRYEDPAGDTGRQKRQRIIIQAILKKALSLDSIMNYQSVFNNLEDNVKTNLTMSELVDFQTQYTSSLDHITQEALTVHDMYIDGTYYAYASRNEVLRISNVLRESLGLQPTTRQEINTVYIPGMSEFYDGEDRDDDIMVDPPYYYSTSQGLVEETNVFEY